MEERTGQALQLVNRLGVRRAALRHCRSRHSLQVAAAAAAAGGWRERAEDSGLKGGARTRLSSLLVLLSLGYARVAHSAFFSAAATPSLNICVNAHRVVCTDRFYADRTLPARAAAVLVPSSLLPRRLVSIYARTHTRLY